MKKSIILLGAFALLVAAPSFGQTQESSQATTTQKSEKSAVLKKQEVKPQKATAQRKTMKAQTATAAKPASSAERDVQKAEPKKMETQKAVREEN